MGNLVFGVVLVVAGIGGHVFLSRRAFYRRNAAGVEEFSGYGKAVATKTVEGAGRLVFTLMTLAGVGAAVAGLATMYARSGH